MAMAFPNHPNFWLPTGGDHNASPENRAEKLRLLLLIHAAKDLCRLTGRVDPMVAWNRSRYAEDVVRSIHVRLDDASAAALEIVRATEMTPSEAVRIALREAAARRRVRSAIAQEVAELADDAEDRDEMRLIREQLA
ncbi:MAG: hypothetical protein ACRDNS_29425, partial [Trebonia sp.]